MMITPSPELEFDLEGTVDIKVFLKRQRGDEVLVLKELLLKYFPSTLSQLFIKHEVVFVNTLKILNIDEVSTLFLRS